VCIHYRSTAQKGIIYNENRRGQIQEKVSQQRLHSAENKTSSKCMPSPAQHSDTCRYDLDLWPMTLIFFSETHSHVLISAAGFTQFPPLSTEISRHAKLVLRHGRGTRKRTAFAANSSTAEAVKLFGVSAVRQKWVGCNFSMVINNYPFY